MSSSERYEILQDDLDGLFERIEASLDLMKKKKNLEEKRYWANRSRSELSEAQRLIHEMELEARAAPIQFKGEMLGKVRQLRETSARLQMELRKQSDSLQGPAKKDGHDFEDSGSYSQDEMYKQQVMQGARILEKTSQSIVRSHQVAVETEAVGEAIVTDLSYQRESLERSRAMLQETDAEITRSRKILKRLAVSTIYNKMILIVIIIIQVGIIAGLVYWKWFTKKS